jgi:choline dehydrogenase-like flavoprotein
MTAMVSITADRFDAPFPKTMYVNDFYWKDPQGVFDHPMGHIQLLEHMDGHVLEGQVEEEGIPPFAIPDFLSGAAAERMLAFLCISEDLPSPDNRVHLDKDGRIHLDYTHGNLEGHKRLVQKLDHAMDRFSDNGSHGSLMHHHFQVSQMLPLYGTAHMCGTTRFGDDPKTSVLDRNCKAHQLDNLYITDASFFPSAAAVNPTLTIVANAWRVGRHLRERLGA